MLLKPKLYKKRINDVIEYYNKYKKLPSSKHHDLKIRSMGVFLCTQKKLYREKKLLNHRLNLLNTIPTFNINSYRINSFEDNVKTIIDYYKKHNHLPTVKNKPLYKFLLRQKYLNKNNELSEERYNLLCTIPTFGKKLNEEYEPSTISYLTYEEKVGMIIDYYNQYKKLPTINDNEFKSFYVFLKSQKTKYHKGKLSEERYKLLCTIPTYEIDKTYDTIFTEKVNTIIEYYNKYYKLPSMTDKVMKSYGNFLRDQRQLYRKGKLSDDRYKLLCTIPTFKERMNN